MPFNAMKLPVGIRIWDAPIIKSSLRLCEGYEFSRMENSEDSYRFTAMVSADKVRDLFRSFTTTLTEEAFFILEFYQEELAPEKEQEQIPTVYYSPYMPPDELLELIDPYLLRMVHDGFVGFGIANNREGVELFYSEEKILNCFTGNNIQTMNWFARNGIYHRPGLSYPTDHGHDHLSLLCHPREELPATLNGLNETEIDYAHFCRELIEEMDMYPVEESLSFFLSKKEQDLIEDLLEKTPRFSEYAQDDFGSLLLDWNDFVSECVEGFQGSLQEYRFGLQLRDMIQFVAEHLPEGLRIKILDIVSDADERMRLSLTDKRKRLDAPCDLPLRSERFWYQGVVANQGAFLRRDLIRQGWFNPAPLVPQF